MSAQHTPPLDYLEAVSASRYAKREREAARSYAAIGKMKKARYLNRLAWQAEEKVRRIANAAIAKATGGAA